MEYKKGYNDALSDIREDVELIINIVKAEGNHNPLGSLSECLADAEIEALKLVLESIKRHSKVTHFNPK